MIFDFQQDIVLIQIAEEIQWPLFNSKSEKDGIINDLFDEIWFQTLL